MRTGFARWITVAVVSLAPIPAAAQVTALPRAPDGKPDLQGIWQVFNTAAWDLQDHHARLGVPPGQGVVEGNEIPYQAWAATKKQENFDKRLTADPEVKGYLPARSAHHVHAVPISNLSDPAPRDNGLRIRPRRSDHLHEREPTSRGTSQFLVR